MTNTKLKDLANWLWVQKILENCVEGTEVTLHHQTDLKRNETIHGTTAALNNMVTVYRRIQERTSECAGLDTVHNFADQNLFWLLVTTRRSWSPEGITLNFQTQQQSLLAEFQRSSYQTAAYVCSLSFTWTIQRQGSVMLVNMFAAKKVNR